MRGTSWIRKVHLQWLEYQCLAISCCCYAVKSWKMQGLPHKGWICAVVDCQCGWNFFPGGESVCWPRGESSSAGLTVDLSDIKRTSTSPHLYMWAIALVAGQSRRVLGKQASGGHEVSSVTFNITACHCKTKGKFNSNESHRMKIEWYILYFVRIIDRDSLNTITN